MGFIARYIGHRAILSPLRISDSRRQSIVRLLQYANANVPYYEGRYSDFLERCNALNDHDFLRAFAETPVTTKQDLNVANAAFSSRVMASKVDLLKNAAAPDFLHALWSLFIRKNFKISISTGGSSGIPTYRWLDHDDANVMAQSFLESFHCNGWRRGEAFVVYYPLQSYFTDTYAAFNDWLHRLFGFSVLPFTQVTKDSVRELLDTLSARKATLLVIFPCVLQRVAEIMREEGMAPNHALQYINVSGEFFFDCSRAFVQEMFPNARIEMTYGCVELGELAHQHGGSSFDYKIFEDFAYFEQSDDDGLIITALHQKAFPLIRYKMEDKGSVIDQNDGTQLLLRLEGKNTDFLTGADGKRYYASFFNDMVNTLNKTCQGNIIHFMMRHEGNAAHLNFVMKTTGELQQAHITRHATALMTTTFPQFTDVRVAFLPHFNHDYTRKFKIIGQGDGLAEVVGGYYKQSTP